MKAIASLNKQVTLIMDEKTETRKQRPEKILTSKDEDEYDNNEKREERDLLDLMMDCQNEEGAVLTREELANQTKTFLLAGYETSSTCILWTMHLLALHPDIQEKLAEEIRSVIGTDRAPSADDIDKMQYMYKVLRESLRIRPPIPFVLRHASEDTSLGGYFIPKNTSILVGIHHQHHHSPVWENPEEFNPNRWAIDESETAHLVGSFIPFIMGARNCIGSRFAMLEVRVMLAMIMQKLKFSLPPGATDPGTMTNISMSPRKPIKLLFSKRN